MHKKKAITMLILTVLFLTAVLSCMNGCTKNDNRFDTDLFCCMYNEEKTGVIILSLTKKGREQETLVIPKEINDRPVIGINGTKGMYQANYLPDSSFVKKIYILADLKLIGEYVFHSAINLKIIYIGIFQNTAIATSAFPNETTIVVEKKQENFLSIFDYHVKKRSMEIQFANTYYYINDSMDKPYWIDYYINDEKIVYPPEPLNPGKSFTGWITQDGQLWDKKLNSDLSPIKLVAQWK